MDLFGEKKRRAFNEEALPHQDALFRMALSMTRRRSRAQDIVQETYKEAWRSFDRFHTGTNCKAWLFTILFRVERRHSRRELARRTIALDQVPERQLASRPDFDLRVDHDGVLSLLETLPEHYRIVLVLADVESLSYREVARTLAIPIGTVMSRLNRGRALLREKLAGDRSSAQSA